MKRIRFHVSDAFLQKFEKILGESSSRGKLVRIVLQHWDGRIRQIPDAWRGDKDLRISADDVLEQIIESALGKGVVDRHDFLLQAFAQLDADPDAVKRENGGAKGAKTARAAKRHEKTDRGQTAEVHPVTETASRRSGFMPVDQQNKLAPIPSKQPVKPTASAKTGQTPKAAKNRGMESTSDDFDGLSPKRMAVLKRNLLAMQKNCMERIFDLSNGERESHEKSMDGDDADLAALNIERTERQNEIFRLQKQLREIDHALNKMTNGVYGYCEETGEPINFERLLANPTARLSLEAQQHKEKSLRMVA